MNLTLTIAIRFILCMKNKNRRYVITKILSDAKIKTRAEDLYL